MPKFNCLTPRLANDGNPGRSVTCHLQELVQQFHFKWHQHVCPSLVMRLLWQVDAFMLSELHTNVTAEVPGTHVQWRCNHKQSCLEAAWQVRM